MDDSTLSASINFAIGAKQSISCWPEGLGRVLQSMQCDLHGLAAARELILSDCGLGSGGAGAMALVVRASMHLSVCDLSRNNVGDMGALAIAEALRGSSELGVLRLAGNSIGSAGGVALAVALRSNRSLSVLDLAGNRIETSGGSSMAETIRTNQTLTDLNLSGTAIGNMGGRAVADAVRFNASLRSLDLRDNGFDATTEGELVQAGGGRVHLDGQVRHRIPSAKRPRSSCEFRDLHHIAPCCRSRPRIARDL